MWFNHELMNDVLNFIQDYIPKVSLIDFIEILILIFVLYKILLLIQNTKAWIFLKGVIVLLGVYIISDIVGFHAIKIIFEGLFNVLIILLIVVFQQELKKMLGEIGKKGNQIFKIKFGKKEKEYEKLLEDKEIDAICSAIKDMSAVKTGALILIERDLPLKEYSDTGIKVDSTITAEMLVQIFEKNTPLHDGAVIINNNRIESATCYLPLSNNEKINKTLGTRHRAAIGITEVTDTIAIVVSEETGKISICRNGRIVHGVTVESVRKQLKEIQTTKIEIKSKDSLKKNWKTKIISCFAALAIWMVLINSVDPTITKTVDNVSVTVLNSNVITDTGMSYQVISGDNISVTLKGKKSVIDNINSNSISAYADISNLSITNATEIITSCSIDNVEVSPNTKMMKISIEDTKEVDYDVDIEKIGTLQSNNYISSIELDKPSIKISGPISKIDIIGSIVAKVNISNVSDGDIVEITPIIYDKNGNEMDLDDLALDTKTLKATIHMYETKTVPLTVSVYNTNEFGEIMSYSYEKDDITVAANEETLTNTNGIFIEIPLNIDESVQTSEFMKVINITDFLPKNLYLAESDNKLNINISYEKYIEKNIEINTSDITFEGKNKKYDYSIDDTINIKIKGREAVISNLIINPTINVADKKPGTYNMDILIDSKYVVGEYKASVTITEGD